eukprot:scaffold141091_cov56-Attheya_sp.AAC.1
MFGHFRPRRPYRDGHTWMQKLKENRAYFKGPIKPPTGATRTKADCLFEELRSSVERKERGIRRRASWISAKTWKLIDTRLALRRVEGHEQAAIRRLIRRVKASMNADRTRWVEIAGANVEALLQKVPLKGWYRKAGDRAPPPSRDTLEKVTATERIALYRKEAPPGESIPILVEPVAVSDEIPEMEDIAEAAVRKLRNNRSGGPSGIRGEHLKGWLTKAELEGGDSSNWRKLVELVQLAFETGEIQEAMAWSLMILLHKGGGDYRGIGLVEVVWKLIASIITSQRDHI